MISRQLLRTSAVVTASAALGSLASTGTRSRWYRSLDKPVIQPPAAAFPVVWTLLYTDIAISSAVVLDRLEDEPEETAYWRALTVNLVLNTAWTWVFFKAERLVPAIGVAGALATSTVQLARRAGAVEPNAGRALVPYAAWCSFATVLTTAIWARNHEAGAVERSARRRLGLR